MSQHPCDVNKRVNCEHKEFILWLTTPHLGHMLEAELEKELFCHFGVMFSSWSAFWGDVYYYRRFDSEIKACKGIYCDKIEEFG